MKYKRIKDYLIFKIDESKSLEDFFHDLHLSKKQIHLLKQNKDYSVNNQFVLSTTLLHINDEVKIKAYDHDDGMYPPNYQELDVIYEDDLLLVDNKPPFLKVFPDHKENTDSLSNRVSAYYLMNNEDIPVRFIHRLDDDTSGLVIYSKCTLLQPYLDYMIETKQIKRSYLALVEGIFNDKQDHIIQTYLGKDRHHSSKMRVSSSGQLSVTHYHLIKQYHHNALIECVLETGRKHQIRVHMSSINHPLIGDTLYNGNSLLNRQALHAYKLELIHPLTKEKLTMTCELPIDIQNILDQQ